MMSPHCDHYTQNIPMGMYYDEYCAQSASEEVNAEDFMGIEFEDVMASAEELECTSCARSVYSRNRATHDNDHQTASAKI